MRSSSSKLMDKWTLPFTNVLLISKLEVEEVLRALDVSDVLDFLPASPPCMS